MKTYELRQILLDTMDEDVNKISSCNFYTRARKIANIRKAISISTNPLSIVSVVINSKEICLLLQDQKWTIANTSTETKTELSGFKLVKELKLADFHMFEFTA